MDTPPLIEPPADGLNAFEDISEPIMAVFASQRASFEASIERERQERRVEVAAERQARNDLEVRLLALESQITAKNVKPDGGNGERRNVGGTLKMTEDRAAAEFDDLGGTE